MTKLTASPARFLCLAAALLVLALIAVRWPGSSALTNNGAMNSLNSAITEDFNTLASSGTSNTWTDNSTIAGWYSTRTVYIASSGTSTTGGLYSFGSTSDRALGGLASNTTGDMYFAVRLTNSTGTTITSFDIAYTGEQWRNGGNTTAQKLEFQYQVANAGVITGANTPGTGWLSAASLDFTGPVATATAGALDGNATGNRAAISGNLSVTVSNGQEIWLRWKDANDAGNDHGLAIDDLSVTPRGGGPVLPALSINDVSDIEGDSGSKTFSFTVSLNAPAGSGGVKFDIATADDTAKTSDSDYQSKSQTGVTIAEGSSTYTFDVTVTGDTKIEPDERFFVNVTNVSGATVSKGQGQGTIGNDDVVLTKIDQIQGNGQTSPFVGQVLSTRGIVTARKSNGFFIQEPDASVDADPATSEGVFVFTSSTPPAAAAVGNQVQVTGTVVEFIPASAPSNLPLTELSSPTVLQISTGNPLPAAVALSASFPSPAGGLDQLERLEGMRVSVASLTVVAPTDGTVNEANATSTSNGDFFGVVTGVARPFREPGIQAPLGVPAGSTIPPVPRFDNNPEIIRIDSNGQTGAAAIDVGTGAVLTNLVGALDYGFGRYTILPDPSPSPTITPGPSAAALADASASQFTVGSLNLERFFDATNDPAIGEPVLTTTAFNNRLNKASLGIRNILRSPDILGVIEVENLTTLQALASKINNDAVAAGQPNPNYQAYLVEGNDVGGIDVGFLVKAAIVAGSTPRVSVTEVVQEGKTLTWIDPSTNNAALLNDRPPLRLTAVVNSADGKTFPITVIVNHLRSLNGIDDESPDGLTTTGNRVRRKRQLQAEYLASLIQARQAANPAERIVAVGDFNAFQFNDGYADLINTIKGTPPPDNQTVVPGDGADLVNPDLTALIDTVPAAERYSYSFEGSAQAIDHILANSRLLPFVASFMTGHFDADYPEVFRNDPNRPERISDHDGPVAYINFCVQVSLSPAALPLGISGVPYVMQTITASPAASYGFQVADGALPPGLNLSTGGVLSGAPSQAGDFTFTVRATDGNNCSGTRQFRIVVLPATAKIDDPFECLGPASRVGVTATLTNPTGGQQSAVFNAYLPAQLLALPGSCTATAGSCQVVDAATVKWTGTLNAGQTVTIKYRAQVADGVPQGTQFSITSEAAVGDSAPVSFTARGTVDCPPAGPGIAVPATSEAGGIKPGSVLIFNYYISGTDLQRENTRLNITNTDQARQVSVHLFWIDGTSCSVTDYFICMTPNQTISLLATDLDPGISGYMIAVAVDSQGCPIAFNHLIGDAFIKTASGFAANLAAYSVSAIPGGLPACDANSNSAVLNFDGAAYNRLPAVLVVDNIPARGSGNQTLLVLNRIGGDLSNRLSSLESLFGLLFDDLEKALSFALPAASCQYRGQISSTNIRTAPRLEQHIPTGRTGWMKIWQSSGSAAMTGAVINYNPDAVTRPDQFNQGHNLHVLTLAPSASLRMPVYPPRC